LRGTSNGGWSAARTAAPVIDGSRMRSRAATAAPRRNQCTREAGSTISLNSTGSYADLVIPETVTFTGGGTVSLSDWLGNRILDDSGYDGHLINEDNTIQGAGQFGDDSLQITNRGVIDANETNNALDINPRGPALNDAGGVFRGSGGGGLDLTGGSFTNNGTLEALDGSTVTYSVSATCENNVAGVLTGGTWRAISTGSGAVVTLRGDPITQIAPDTTVEIRGPGAVIQVGSVPIENTLTDNAGTLNVLGGQDYTSANVLTNADGGSVQLAGGTFSGPGLDNAGELAGYGTIALRPVNSGTIRASSVAFPAQTLIVTGGIQGGSGVVIVDLGATLDLSGASESSSADVLAHNGEDLNLGDPDFLVHVDYRNGNWGDGNAFNPRANVTGSGQILADPAVQQAVTGDVTGGQTADATMGFGDIHVGEAVTREYQITAAPLGPSLRGAIQTASGSSVGSFHLTDPRLVGSGVTPANFGPVGGATPGSFINLSVSFKGDSAGPLVDQHVHVANNFDNVDEQNLWFTGTAWRLAEASQHEPQLVDFGIVHVGDTVSQALTLKNLAVADGYSEHLNAEIGDVVGDDVRANGSFSMLGPEQTDDTNLVVGIDTATAGFRLAAATISLESDGTGTSELGITPLTPQTVGISAVVNNYADPLLEKVEGDGTLTGGPADYAVDLGTVMQGDPTVKIALGLTNDADAPADDLAGDWTLDADDFELLGFTPFGGLGPGEPWQLAIGLDTDTLGLFTGSVTMHPLSENGSGYSGPLDDVQISVTVTVVPEPGAPALLAMAVLMLVFVRRRQPPGDAGRRRNADHPPGELRRPAETEARVRRVRRRGGGQRGPRADRVAHRPRPNRPGRGSGRGIPRRVGRDGMGSGQLLGPPGLQPAVGGHRVRV